MKFFSHSFSFCFLSGCLPSLRYSVKRSPNPTFPLGAVILDYSKVCVNRFFLQTFGVPKTGHYEAVCKEIIRLLREERESRNLSKYAVAQRSGVSESMLSLVERGLRNPTVELMLRMADGIGADLPTLLEKAIASIKRAETGKQPSRKGRSKPTT